MINKNISLKEVNKAYKNLLNRVKKEKIKSFKLFTKEELFIYCLIDTYNYGRSFKDSLSNSLYHFRNKDTIKNYLGLLITPDKEVYF